MDTMPNLNKTLCSGTELYDSGYDLHFVHPSKPLYRVPDGFTWSREVSHFIRGQGDELGCN